MHDMYQGSKPPCSASDIEVLAHKNFDMWRPTTARKVCMSASWDEDEKVWKLGVTSMDGEVSACVPSHNYWRGAAYAAQTLAGLACVLVDTATTK